MDYLVIMVQGFKCFSTSKGYFNQAHLPPGVPGFDETNRTAKRVKGLCSPGSDTHNTETDIAVTAAARKVDAER